MHGGPFQLPFISCQTQYRPYCFLPAPAEDGVGESFMAFVCKHMCQTVGRAAPVSFLASQITKEDSYIKKHILGCGPFTYKMRTLNWDLDDLNAPFGHKILNAIGNAVDHK
ncbi:hypothetical protein JEQ12_015389 [Ovis aries]|uniref:Uncharacterized protein n=1 Tax=Ovis aries TaxID=9940 RepID=A0A836ADT1_SHEEP|nr:hypothetical protein JEQ12_015389 [Ovis aries]